MAEMIDAKDYEGKIYNAPDGNRYLSIGGAWSKLRADAPKDIPPQERYAYQESVSTENVPAPSGSEAGMSMLKRVASYIPGVNLETDTTGMTEEQKQEVAAGKTVADVGVGAGLGFLAGAAPGLAIAKETPKLMTLFKLAGQGAAAAGTQEALSPDSAGDRLMQSGKAAVLGLAAVPVVGAAIYGGSKAAGALKYMFTKAPDVPQTVDAFLEAAGRNVRWKDLDEVAQQKLADEMRTLYKSSGEFNPDDIVRYAEMNAKGMRPTATEVLGNIPTKGTETLETATKGALEAGGARDTMVAPIQKQAQALTTKGLQAADVANELSKSASDVQKAVMGEYKAEIELLKRQAMDKDIPWKNVASKMENLKDKFWGNTDLAARVEDIKKSLSTPLSGFSKELAATPKTRPGDEFLNFQQMLHDWERGSSSGAERKIYRDASIAIDEAFARAGLPKPSSVNRKAIEIYALENPGTPISKLLGGTYNDATVNSVLKDSKALSNVVDVLEGRQFDYALPEEIRQNAAQSLEVLQSYAVNKVLEPFVSPKGMLNVEGLKKGLEAYDKLAENNKINILFPGGMESVAAGITKVLDDARLVGQTRVLQASDRLKSGSKLNTLIYDGINEIAKSKAGTTTPSIGVDVYQRAALAGINEIKKAIDEMSDLALSATRSPLGAEFATAGRQKQMAEQARSALKFAAPIGAGGIRTFMGKPK